MTKEEKLLLLLQLQRDVLNLNSNDQIANSNMALTITVGVFAIYFGITQSLTNFSAMNDLQKSLAVALGALAFAVVLLVHLENNKLWNSKKLAMKLTKRQINDTLKNIGVLKI